MPEKKFKHLVKEMVLSKKLISIGALLLAISCFLPWYSDLDKFNTGTTFLGVSGPLYMAGLITFICASASIFVIVSELVGRRIQKFPLSGQQIHLIGVSVSVLMLLLTSSVYFHPKFGMNLADKKVGFGMVLSIFSLILMLSGTFIALKKKMDKEDLMERHHESLKSLGVEELNSHAKKISLLDDVESERFSYFSAEANNANNLEQK